MKPLSACLSSLRSIIAGVCLFSAGVTGALADVVTDWNLALENSLAVPAERGPRVPVRTLAIMHAAMFDAVNGIERKFKPLHVTDSAPGGARAEAAAIQAAYTVLTALRPVAQPAWEAQLAASLAALPGHPRHAESIARGRAWGTTVANAILAWRAADGSSSVLPPFVGSSAAGYWRHAPLGASPTAGYANLATVPFVLADPLAFDPGPPYGIADRAAALRSAAYAADVNEIKSRGGLTSSVRTPAEVEEALFIDACDVAGLNRLLRSVLRPSAGLVENARAFALFNLTAFDTTVVVFRVKYLHALWRPFQAVNFASEDDNAATDPDPTWKPYLPTPPHPEYISAHVTLFTALLRVAARLEGDCGEVELTAAASTAYPGGSRTFDSLADISDATVEARINVGFHYRETCEISQYIGREIADHIVGKYLTRPGRGHHRH